MLNLIQAARQWVWLQVFTVYVRYLIGAAFVISTFTLNKWGLLETDSYDLIEIPMDELAPLQQYFRLLSTSGLYWKFIAVSQALFGTLLMTQRLARLGAIMFWGIVVNIFMVNLSFGFSATPVITGLMLVAATYLLVWDAAALMPLVSNPGSYTHQPLPVADHRYWVVLGVVMLLSIVAVGLVFPSYLYLLGIPFAEGLVGFVMFWLVYRRKTR